mmetsp:Transcript_24229/g.71926  ORF Transcript_24229/g.71926 Transcript_24229/m.71926 type:complete len:283 (+) Transcript_24229:2528-3376(+)
MQQICASLLGRRGTAYAVCRTGSYQPSQASRLVEDQLREGLAGVVMASLIRPQRSQAGKAATVPGAVAASTWCIDSAALVNDAELRRPTVWRDGSADSRLARGSAGCCCVMSLASAAKREREPGNVGKAEGSPRSPMQVRVQLRRLPAAIARCTAGSGGAVAATAASGADVAAAAFGAAATDGGGAAAVVLLPLVAGGMSGIFLGDALVRSTGEKFAPNSVATANSGSHANGFAGAMRRRLIGASTGLGHARAGMLSPAIWHCAALMFCFACGRGCLGKSVV